MSLQTQEAALQQKLIAQQLTANTANASGNYGAHDGGQQQRYHQWGDQQSYQAEMQHGTQYGNEDGFGYSTYEGMVFANAAEVVCYNCGQRHFVSECTAPMCVGCRQRWPNTNPASGYHHPFQCPVNPLRIGRYGRQGFSGRGMGSRSTGGNMAGRGPMFSAGRGTLNRGAPGNSTGRAPSGTSAGRGISGHVAGTSAQGRGMGTYGGRGGGYSQSLSSNHTAVPPQIIGNKRPAATQSGGRGSQQVPWLHSANPTVYEHQEWDTSEAYDHYVQGGGEHEYTEEEVEEELKDEFPPRA